VIRLLLVAVAALALLWWWFSERRHDRVKQSWLNDEYRRSMNRERAMPDCVGGGWPVRKDR